MSETDLLLNVRVERILLEIDRPQIVILRDVSDALYLATYVGVVDNKPTYLCVKTTESRIAAFEQCATDLRSVYENPEAGPFYAGTFELIRDRQAYFVLHRLSTVPADWLPGAGLVLDDPEATKVSADPTPSDEVGSGEHYFLGAGASLRMSEVGAALFVDALRNHVVVSRAALQAFVLLAVDDWNQWSPGNTGTEALRFRAKVRDTTRIRDIVSTISVKMPADWTAMRQPSDWNLPNTVTNVAGIIAEAAIGDYFDHEGLDAFSRSQVLLELGTYIEKLRRQPPADTEAAYAYIVGKTYWAWDLGVRGATFSHADQVRLGRSLADLRKLAEPDIDEMWRIHDSSSDIFVIEALPKLLRQARHGTLPISPFEALFDIRSKLAAPRYALVLSHLERAVTSITSSPSTPKSASFEALSAFEAMLTVVARTAPQTAAIEALRRLQSEHRLHPALRTSLEGVWEFRNSVAHVDYGEKSSTTFTRAEILAVFNLIAAAISLLREIDR